MKTKYIFSGLLALTLVSSCSEKMDYKEYNVYDKAYVDKMFSRVGGLMTNIYNDIDYDFGNYSGAMASSATDESVYSHPGNAVEDFYNGAWGPTNAKERVWNSAWDGISYCNLVLDEFSNCTFPEYTEDEHYQQEMFLYKNYRWEARWARAFFYFELVKRYGSVPLKTKHMTANEANSRTCQQACRHGSACPRRPLLGQSALQSHERQEPLAEGSTAQQRRHRRGAAGGHGPVARL